MEKIKTNMESKDLTLKDILNQIIERGQPLFKNPLKIEYDSWTPHMVYRLISIYEVTNAYWFRIIPYKRHRRIFTIHINVYDYLNKSINCTIFDPSLLSIVKEEIEKFAVIVKAEKINITRDFSN